MIIKFGNLDKVNALLRQINSFALRNDKILLDAEHKNGFWDVEFKIETRVDSCKRCDQIKLMLNE